MPNRLTRGGVLVGSINGTTVTEIGKLASVTGGTAAASKAVVLDANLSVAGVTVPVTTVTANTTLTAASSGGLIEINAAATKTMTLPAANAVAAGVWYRFALKVASTSGVGHTVHPVGSDVMRGNGFTPAGAKGAVNTQATSAIGDGLTIVSNGVDAWYIVAIIGTWAREA